MGDSYGDPQKGRNFNGPREGSRGGFRGGRGPNNRDQGGFRIRLSDNEMNAARRIQETFNLRSTVAVLGFAVRTLGQLVEEGKLEELIEQYRSEGPKGSGNQSFQRHNNGIHKGEKVLGTKPNPFARPDKPLPQEPSPTDDEESQKSEESEESEVINTSEDKTEEDPIDESIDQKINENDETNSNEK